MKRLQHLAPWALALLSGVFYFVGFVGFDQSYLAWFALAPLLLALSRVERPRTALLLSWFMGLVTHLGGYHWIPYLLQTFAGLNKPLSFLGYLLLCLGQSGQLALFGLLAWALFRRRGVPLAFAAPVALVASELCFPFLFQSYLANSQAWNPHVTQVLDLGGPLLLSGLIAFIGGAIAELLLAFTSHGPTGEPGVEGPRAKRRGGALLRASLAAALVLAALLYSAVRLEQVERLEASSEKLRTTIVQANVGAAQKHEQVREGVERFKRMTDEAMTQPDTELVVWPESALNAFVHTGQNLTGMTASQIGAPMIVGALRLAPGTEQRSQDRRLFNSAFSVAAGGEVTASYDKTMLLAFGEYIPFGEQFPGLYSLFPYTGRFERGRSLAPLPVGPWRLSADICYEDILPGFIRALMGARDADGHTPHAMVNLTNDSWYGPVEPRIHLALATFRAIEHRRWLIRSTATGVSAFIDSAGRIVDQTAFEKAELLTADVPMIIGGPTLYGRIGDLLGWLALGFCAWRLAPLMRAAWANRRIRRAGARRAS